MKTETFSYLPALSDKQVTKQIQYFLKNDWVVGIEYCIQPYPELAFWNWWKLPLFTASTAEEITVEINACKAAHPDSYIRLTSYDNLQQKQVMSFVVRNP